MTSYFNRWSDPANPFAGRGSVSGSGAVLGNEKLGWSLCRATPIPPAPRNGVATEYPSGHSPPGHPVRPSGITSFIYGGRRPGGGFGALTPADNGPRGAPGAYSAVPAVWTRPYYVWFTRDKTIHLWQISLRDWGVLSFPGRDIPGPLRATSSTTEMILLFRLFTLSLDA